MTLPTPGSFAVIGATTYQVASVAADTVNLIVPREDDIPSVPILTRGQHRSGGRWVKVAKAQLGRYFRVHVTVRWQGEEFGLGRVRSGQAEIFGGSPPVAARLGLDGDQYNGYRAEVPAEELSVVDVRETDIDV